MRLVQTLNVCDLFTLDIIVYDMVTGHANNMYKQDIIGPTTFTLYTEHIDMCTLDMHTTQS
jgi:hypothetical protein